METLRGKRLLGRLRMMDLGTFVIKSRTLGGLKHCAHGGADIVGSLVRILLNVTILALRILRWLLDFLWMEVAQDLVK